MLIGHAAAVETHEGGLFPVVVRLMRSPAIPFEFVKTGWKGCTESHPCQRRHACRHGEPVICLNRTIAGDGIPSFINDVLLCCLHPVPESDHHLPVVQPHQGEALRNNLCLVEASLTPAVGIASVAASLIVVGRYPP